MKNLNSEKANEANIEISYAFIFTDGLLSCEAFPEKTYFPKDVKIVLIPDPAEEQNVYCVLTADGYSGRTILKWADIQTDF